MTAPVKANSGVETLTDVLLVSIVLSVGLMAGAASFNHVHDWTMHNSPTRTAGWFGWANAVITELIPTAALIIIARRRRHGGPIAYPMFLLIIAVGLSLTAQLAVARPTVFGWMVSALPALAFFALSKLVFTATKPAPSTTDPAGAGVATTEALHQLATRVHDLETRPTPSVSALTPATSAPAPSPEVPAAAKARPAAKKTTAKKTTSTRRAPAKKTTPANATTAPQPVSTVDEARPKLSVPEPRSVRSCCHRPGSSRSPTTTPTVPRSPAVNSRSGWASTPTSPSKSLTPWARSLPHRTPRPTTAPPLRCPRERLDADIRTREAILGYGCLHRAH